MRYVSLRSWSARTLNVPCALSTNRSLPGFDELSVFENGVADYSVQGCLLRHHRATIRGFSWLGNGTSRERRKEKKIILLMNCYCLHYYKVNIVGGGGGWGGNNNKGNGIFAGPNSPEFTRPKFHARSCPTSRKGRRQLHPHFMPCLLSLSKTPVANAKRICFQKWRKVRKASTRTVRKQVPETGRIGVCLKTTTTTIE